MNYCNSCKKTVPKCNCPKETCCDSPQVHYYENKTHCCKETKCGCEDDCSCNKCNPLKYQLDFKEVFYKIKGNGCASSNMDNLGIEKGADLEYVIEKFGRFITSFNYFDIRDNIYEAKDFTAFIDALQEDISELRLEITNLCEKYENIQLSLNAINQRLDKLEKPKIIDTRGLGFTINDTIFKVLQKISDNG